MGSPAARLGPIATLVSVALVLPMFLPNSFYVEVAILVAVNAIVCIGLNLLFGYAGQISLGHAGFFGLGAYSSALLTKFGVPSLASVAVSAVAVGVLAYVVGKPILRLAGHYLAMATLGIGIVIWTFFAREVDLTGGPDGMAVRALRVGNVAVTGQWTWYWIFACALVLTAFFAERFVASPIGRALRAIRGSEVAASTAGIDVSRYKVLVFVISAVLACLAGSLYAHYAQFVTPGEATFFRSIEFVTMIVLGGLASIYGAIVGAAILTVLPHLFAVLHDFEMVVIGAILVLCMVLMPNGLVPTLSRLVKERVS
jgi:branched-chain amino acid transport system permease protein